MEKVQLLMWSCRDGREMGEERKGQWSNEGQGSALVVWTHVVLMDAFANSIRR